MKKVLILSPHFPPSGGPAVQRMTKVVSYLPEFGWEPVVLANSPTKNEPRDDVLLKEFPSELRVFRISGLNIPQAVNCCIVRALLRAFIQPDLNRVWAERALPSARKLLEDGSFSAVYSTGPAGAHWLGWKLKREYGLPWIMDIRDLWTSAFTYKPVSFFHAAIDRGYEKSFLESADRVSCVSEAYPSILQELYPEVPARKFVVVPNGYDEADFTPGVESSDTGFLISYVGSVYDFMVKPRAQGWKRFFEPLISGGPAVPIRSPEPLIFAVRALLDKVPEAMENVRLRFVGSFPDSYRRMLSDYNLEDCVENIGYVNHSRAVTEMQEAAVLVLIQDGYGSEIDIPGKLYEYLRSGTPVLGLLRDGLAARLIRESSAGEVIYPTDRQGVSRVLLDWYRRWREGKPLSDPDMAYIRRFTRREQTRLLAEHLDEIEKIPS